MSIRVCIQGHVTGQRHCHCGADATQLLKDRQIPTPTHTLIARAKAARVPTTPSKQVRLPHYKRNKTHRNTQVSFRFSPVLLEVLK